MKKYQSTQQQAKHLLHFQVVFTNVILKEGILTYCCLIRMQHGFHYFYVAK